MKEVLYTVAENILLAPGVFRMRISGDTSAITLPGQFLELKLPGFYLRRPISVCDWDEEGAVIIYRVVGGGTDWLSHCAPGDSLMALSGLGNGFNVAACGEKTLVIGGGIGIPPMYGLAKRMLAAGKTPIAVLASTRRRRYFMTTHFRSLGSGLSSPQWMGAAASGVLLRRSCRRSMTASVPADLSRCCGRCAPRRTSPAI